MKPIRIKVRWIYYAVALMILALDAVSFTLCLVGLGVLSVWLACAFIARCIVRSNYQYLPYPVFPHPERREGLLPLMWAQQWIRHTWLAGPIGLWQVLDRVFIHKMGDFRLGFSLKPLPRYYRPNDLEVQHG